MLETTVIPNNGKRRTRRIFLLPISIGLHVVLITGAIFAGVWQVDLPENAPPQISSYQTVIAAPTPPPAPPAPIRRSGQAEQARPQQQPLTPTLIPEAIPQPQQGPGHDEGTPNGSPEGEPGGEPGGVPGGVPGGLTLGPPPPPAPVPPQVWISKPPRILYQVKPDYPQAAWRGRLKGSVVLRCIVDRSGAVRDVSVVRSSNAIFEAAAMDALRQWRFEPGSLNGNPVEVVFNLHVKFELR